jgi:uncharacterized membrane protein
MMSGVASQSFEPPSAPDGDGARVFELAPHRSLTTRGACLFVGGMAFVTFSVATVFTLQGFWPVLPFAGLEIALLAWVMRCSMMSGRERERIVVTVDSVTIEHRCAHGTQVSVFPRHWAKVKLHAPLAAHHPSRLTLESHGRACEVGRFLTEDARRSLAACLKQLVGNVNESPALG